jgi:hypothetical protein
MNAANPMTTHSEASPLKGQASERATQNESYL